MTNLMQYLPPLGTQQSAVPASGAGKYRGAVATGYDAKRVDDPKWRLEQAIIERLLGELPDGASVLDAPIGTGRFLDYYQRRNFTVYGLDLSDDMLNEALRKVTTDGKVFMHQGTVLEVPLPDNSVDATVNCRITRWLSPQDCQKMLMEMQRVARNRIIWTARISNHKHARSIELFEPALRGWRITRNEIGIDMDYRILMAEPAKRVKRGDVLLDLVRANGWTRGAEIGVLDGTAVFFKLLDGCPDLSLTAVDIWAADNKDYGDLTRIGEDFRRRAWEYGDRARVLKGHSPDMAAHVDDGSLDFIFIDADHSTEALLADLAAWRLKVREGGGILGHDIDWPSVETAVKQVFGDSYEILPDDVWMAV